MKCFSIDLDGTLLNSKQEISKQNEQVMKELMEQGHCVILNTGRAVADVVKLEAVRNLEVPIFCINGSNLYSANRELLYEAVLPIPTYKEIFEILKGLGVGILVYTNHGGLPCTLPPLHGMSNQEIDAMFEQFNYDDILALEDLKIYKVIALVYPEELEKIEAVKKAIVGKFDVSAAPSFFNNLEITSSQAHKGKAILRFQEMMNLTFEEIIAFGDGGNDLAQFEVATTAVAMGNAPHHVQQQADVVTKTNDEDGFAYAVRHLLDL